MNTHPIWSKLGTKSPLFRSTGGLLFGIFLANMTAEYSFPDIILATDIQGQVFYRGPVPESTTIPITKDSEVCGTSRKNTPIRVHTSGGLQHVIISIQGHPDTDSDQTQDYVLTNKGCEFYPAVGTVSINQKIHVSNKDAILHNTHIRTTDRAFLNVVLLPDSKGITKPFKKPGPMTIQCNKHPFMAGAIYVFAHPFHTTTDEQGLFRISGLTPGVYTLRSFHPVLGTQEQKVTIPSDGLASVTVEFSAPPP